MLPMRRTTAVFVLSAVSVFLASAASQLIWENATTYYIINRYDVPPLIWFASVWMPLVVVLGLSLVIRGWMDYVSAWLASTLFLVAGPLVGAPELESISDIAIGTVITGCLTAVALFAGWSIRRAFDWIAAGRQTPVCI
jgi:hypothetical protein